MDTVGPDTLEVSILHPETGQPLGVFVTVSGLRTEMAKVNQRRLSSLLWQQALRKTGGKPIVTEAMRSADNLALLVGLTKSWRSLLHDEAGNEIGDCPEIELDRGEWLPCTPDNVRRVYREIPWFASQVDMGAGRLGDTAV